MVVLRVAFLFPWLTWSLSMPCSNLLLTSSPLHLLLLFTTSLQGSGFVGLNNLLQQVSTDLLTEPDIKLGIRVMVIWYWDMVSYL